ncbi:uncharacterized protein LOC133296046, partial [Gastrolobium bilobum]|uniref:uncharacterized protein LOC133296046 n=1 Tax=Gastrolobium bilobum TaxID=150636 RepID=UPI002AB0F81F
MSEERETGKEARDATAEEEDLLHRSTKKPKGPAMEDQPMDDHMAEEDIQVNVTSNGGKKERGVSDAEDWVEKLRKEEDEEEEDEVFVMVDGDEDPLCPTYSFPKALHLEGCRPWRQAVIVKLLGKKVGVRFLLNRLLRMWNISSTYEFIGLENDYFLFRFSNKNYYSHVLEDVPWIIADHYLVVQRWRPFFNPYDDEIRKLAVWIRIPGLPIEFYTSHHLWNIGSIFGRTLKIDRNSIRSCDSGEGDITERAKFARICVDVDIRKGFLPKFRITDRIFHVGYEGLHLVCFACGKYGHRRDQCSHSNLQQDITAYSSEVSDSVVHKQPEKDSISAKEEPFGNWMLVQRNRRSRSIAQSKEESLPSGRRQVGVVNNAALRNKAVSNSHPNHRQVIQSGSRFQAIAELAQKDNNILIISDSPVIDSISIESGLTQINHGELIAHNEESLVKKDIQMETDSPSANLSSGKPRKEVQSQGVKFKENQKKKATASSAKVHQLVQNANISKGRLNASKCAESQKNNFKLDSQKNMSEDFQDKQIVLHPSLSKFQRKTSHVVNDQQETLPSSSGLDNGGKHGRPPDALTGAEKRGFPPLIRDLSHRYSIKVMALLETRLSGVMADRAIQRLGFSGHFHRDAVGFSGGIWVLWNTDEVSVDVLFSHHQLVHTKICWVKENREEFMTFIYASPRRQERIQLWEILSSLFDQSMRNAAWGITGDFNTYLYEYEKLGGNGHNWNSMREFCDSLDECSLSDIGNQGPIFTWQRRNLQERLDRVCANDNRNLVFPNRVAFNLVFFGSDHRPVLLWEGQPAIYPRGESPFRFLASWIALKRKNDLHARIKSIDRCLSYQYSHSLEMLQKDLLRELDKVYLQEEITWFQRSKLNWFALGDRNSRFFHSVTVARRRRNHIDTLKNSKGVWIGDQQVLMEMVVSFFENLYTKDPLPKSAFLVRGFFPVIEAHALDTMSIMSNSKEIRDVVFSFGPYKSPGKDELNALFFQS